MSKITSLQNVFFFKDFFRFCILHDDMLKNHYFKLRDNVHEILENWPYFIRQNIFNNHLLNQEEQIILRKTI